MQLANLPDIESDLETTDHMTKEMLIGTLPDKRFRKHVTDDLVDLVNSETNSELRRVFRDNILTYSSVLTGGKYSLAAYINAVKFVSLTLMGDKSSVAYSKVFPDRYNNLILKNTSASQIASFADNYKKNGLITRIMEQTLVPTHILNAGVYQEAINTQVELMRSANSELVRQKAAESLLTNLKAPETAKIEIDVNYSNDIVDELREATRKLAQQQMKMIMHGQSDAKQIAHSEIHVEKTDPDIVDV